MNKVKKIFIFIIAIALSMFLFIDNVNVNATESDNGLGSYMVTENYEYSNFTYTTHRSDKGISTANSNASNQNVNVFTQKQTDNSKIVAWAISTGSGFVRKKLTEIAADYEKNHPDWEVIGGINADQYIQKYGQLGVADGSDVFCPQPYYPMIADGDSWFSIPCWPVKGGGNIAAFLKGGVADSIVSGSMNFNAGNVKIKGLFLSIYDEKGNVSKKYPIEKVNEKPNNGESAIWIGYVNENKVADINVNGTNLFVVSKALQAYMSNTVKYADWKKNDATNALFAKGTIDSVSTQATISKGGFAIDTTNAELLNDLKVGSAIRVQYEYEGIYNEVETAIGFHTVQRMDGKDIASNASYNTKQYARSLFGRKANGDIVLITVDMGNSEAKGSSHNETNAILKHYGCVEAYQMDGGGSVGATIKKNGKFVYINQNTEERAIFSGLFAVERKKPEYSVEITDITETTAKFKVNLLNDYHREILDTYIKINDKDYKVVDGEVNVTGLRKNRDYNWSLCFEDTSGKDMKTEYKGKFSTIKDAPTYRGCKVTELNGEMTFEFDFLDRAKAITEYSIIVDEQKTTVEVIDGEYKPITIAKTDKDIIFEYKYVSGLKEEKITIINPQFVSSMKLQQLLEKQKLLLKKYFKR